MKARMSDYLSAVEAARRLGVSRQTLYAYVSRGLLRAHETGDPRQRRYEQAAVARLATERGRGRRPKDVAKATLDWGLPVLESGIALIQDGRLYFRGRDALALARDAMVEDVAALLWDLPAESAFGADAPAIPLAARSGNGDLLAVFAAATTDDDTAVWRRDPHWVAAGCGALVRTLLSFVTGAPPASGPVHLQLGVAWALDDAGTDLVRMALILCADHELNASSFTARCVASTGASLRSAVIGGLAALSGAKHGGTTARIETFWRATPPHQIRHRLAAGDDLPGFGHPLYPGGDIRAEALLARVLPLFPEARSFAEAAEHLTGRKANIDFALVALRRFLGLPEGAAFGLFALGRCIGWIAHALEQRETGQLIRPRAIYVGPPPDTGPHND